MFEVDFVALAAELAAADPATCDRVGLTEIVSSAQRARGWLDALDVRVAVHAAKLASEGSCESAGDVLADGGRRSSRDAHTAARRGSVCDHLPRVHDALARGALSAGHVDAIARLAAELDDAGRAELRDVEAAIVGSAMTNTVETFEREMRNLGRILSHDAGTAWLAQRKQQRKVRRWVDKVTGMCHTHLELDPETDARVAAAFDAAVAASRARQQGAETDFDHLKADALVDLITGARATDHRVPEVSVLIDYHTLRHGLHERSVCETNDGQYLPPDTVRRMCCDGEIIPIVLGGDGVPLDHGRARRLATREQRRALRVMYRTCGHPHCIVRFDDCRVHHVTWWEHLGPTDLSNLLPLCEAHHHLVHEGGWTLTLKPDRTITLRRPDGSLHHEGDTTDRQPDPATSAPPSAAETERPPPGGGPVPAANDADPRPGESNIPLHLRRAARPRPAPSPTPVPTVEADAGSNPLATTDLPSPDVPAALDGGADQASRTSWSAEPMLSQVGPRRPLPRGPDP